METSAEELPEYQEAQPEPPSDSDRKKKQLIAIVVVIVILAVLALLLILLQPAPDPGTEQEHILTISNVEVTNSTKANVTFGEPTNNPHPVKLKVIISTLTESGVYIFPSNMDGADLARISGDNMGFMVFRDFADNEKIDPGDMILMTGLEKGTLHNISIRWEPNDHLIDYQEFLTLPGPPYGQFALVDPTSNTTVNITFDSFSKDVEPMDMYIILEKDGIKGTYVFPSNDDWTNLSIISGDNLGNMIYRDVANNSIVNSGDLLLLSNLSPSSDFTITLVWEPTQVAIDVRSFSTPA
ncbi:MAG: hypothetical protein JSV43_06125 [Methanobacteriota archaeon]|nr:MAG: hypothetical protein JSV43_06125 [Euryarchaeota archaeon]